MFNRNDFIVNNNYYYIGNGFEHKLPIGIPTIDIALGGGIPLDGALIEIFGEESHGKTTLSYRICKRCTDENGYITWIDSETSYDESWARVQGVNTERLIPYRIGCMEDTNDVIIADIKKYKETYLPWLLDNSWKPTKSYLDSVGIDSKLPLATIKEQLSEIAPSHIIVWDSLAGSPVRSVAEAGANYSEGIAYRARLIKSFLSRYRVHVEGCSKVAMILVNQVIDNIGDTYGPAFSTPGGRGLKHSKHLSIYVKKSGSGEKDSENYTITDYVVLSIVKNKITPVIASFPVIFSKARGFLGATSVLEYLLNMKWFTNAGSWKKFDYITYDESTGEIINTEEVSFQKGNFYTLIGKRPEIFLYLCNQIKQLISLKFPENPAISNVNIEDIIEACLAETNAIPTEEETISIDQ